MIKFSIIVPAFNEEKYIGQTLHHINLAKVHLSNRGALSAEILVVDNGSTDQTACVVQSFGAIVVKESVHNIAKVRNTGAKFASGDILLFIDADTLVPKTLLLRISQVMSDPSCLGGAVDTDYRPARLSVRLYLKSWRLLGMLADMAQGAVQFCRRDAYVALQGYDESIYMGEDVDFYWRLRKSAKERGMRICHIQDVKVIPSSRRFDQWPLWRTLVWTNPLFVYFFRRSKGLWSRWYSDVPR